MDDNVLTLDNEYQEDVDLEGEVYAVGERGYSAYEIALQNGYVGTEEEWLESLKGDPGYSPSASVTKSGDTATITITDEQGTTTAMVSDGEDGEGVPTGGTAGQILSKVDGTDYNTEWVNAPDISNMVTTNTTQNIPGQKIFNSYTPKSPNVPLYNDDIANKKYVDDTIQEAQFCIGNIRDYNTEAKALNLDDLEDGKTYVIINNLTPPTGGTYLYLKVTSETYGEIKGYTSLAYNKLTAPVYYICKHIHTETLENNTTRTYYAQLCFEANLLDYVNDYTIKNMLYEYYEESSGSGGHLTTQVTSNKIYAVNTNGTQNISGKKTFTSNLPESSIVPTTNNQLTNKKYVDDAINNSKTYVEGEIDYVSDYSNAFISETVTDTAIEFNNTIDTPLKLELAPSALWQDSEGEDVPNPSNPEVIHSVTGDNTITITGRNLSKFSLTTNSNGILFNENEVILENPTSYKFNNDWNLKNNSNLSGKTYTIYTLTNGSISDGYANFIISKTGTEYAYLLRMENTTYNNSIKVATVTLGADEVFTNTRVEVNGTPTASLNIKVMIVEGNYTTETIGDYEPYQAQVLPVNLGNLEYCKLGTVSDEFIYNTDNTDLELNKWYLKKNIAKFVLNGTENWSDDIGTVGTDYRHNIRFDNNGLPLSIPSRNGMSNYFHSNYSTRDGSFEKGEFYCNDVWLVIWDKNKQYDLNEFKTWLSTHNTIAYYICLTPQYILLNDTLQSQLTAVYNKAKTFDGQTNIVQTNTDLPFVIKATNIQKVEKGSSSQVEEMPVASEDNLDRIVQYVGSDETTYTTGYFYQCVSDGEDPATYSWEQINVQPGSSGGDDEVYFIENINANNPFIFEGKKRGIYILKYPMTNFPYKINEDSNRFTLLNTQQIFRIDLYQDMDKTTQTRTGVCKIYYYTINVATYSLLDYCEANYDIAYSNTSYVVLSANSTVIHGKYVNSLAQTFDGVKTFTSIPEQSNTNAPTLDTQFTNKAYVDSKAIQYSTMPTASSSTVGKIVQYTGTTDANYTNGYFYIGTENNSTYSWEQLDVQPNGGSGGNDNELILKLPDNYGTMFREIASGARNSISFAAETNAELATFLQAMYDNGNDVYRISVWDKYTFINQDYTCILDFNSYTSRLLSAKPTVLELCGYPRNSGANTNPMLMHRLYIQLSWSGDVLSISSGSVTNDGEIPYLNKQNTTSYTPSSDYNPATKKYVDDNANPVVTTSSTASYTIASLTGNKVYKLGEITDLTITAVTTFDKESVIYFDSGSTPTTISIPDALTNLGDVPTLTTSGGVNTGTCAEDKSYIIAIENNIAIWKEY